MSRLRLPRADRPASARRVLPPRKRRFRRAAIEALEPRQVLAAPTLAALSNLTAANGNPLYGGAPMNIALNGFDADGDALTYTVSISNATVPLTAIIPEGNPSLRLSVYSNQGGTPANIIQGDMVFELFNNLGTAAQPIAGVPNTVAQISSLANQSRYNGSRFHRVMQDFMIQGGIVSGTVPQIDDEFNAALMHTSKGVLSMAKTSADDSGTSQFFITAEPTRHLDFNHSVFGFMTKGETIREKIAAVRTGTGNAPTNDVVITGTQIFYDTQNRVLRLSAADGASGTARVTVTVSDGHGGSDSKSFNVDIRPESDGLNPTTNKYPITSSNPFLRPVGRVQTPVNTTVTVPVPAFDVEGNTIVYDTSLSPSNPNVAVSSVTAGAVTVTPSNGYSGVYNLIVRVRDKLESQAQLGVDVWDQQKIPVYVGTSAQPTGVDLLASSDPDQDGTTNRNNTADKRLSFRVHGAWAGATVELFSDGNWIGSASASEDGSVVVITSGTFTLTDGPHSITAKQTVQGMASPLSAARSITVDTTAPVFEQSAVPGATEGQPYVYDVRTVAEAAGSITYDLKAAPTGMAIDSSTGRLTWLPGDAQGPTQTVTVGATDRAGNPAQRTFTIGVTEVNQDPTARPQAVSTPQNTNLSIQLAGDDGDSAHAQTLQFALVAGSGPSRGEILGFNAATGTLIYRPDSNASGQDEFSFTVTDDATAGGLAKTSAPAKVTITVNPVNNRPTANPQSRTVGEDSSAALALTGDDNDPEVLQALTFTVSRQPAHGTLSGLNRATGAVIYTPALNYNGPDSFAFTVTDDAAAGGLALVSFPAEVSITVSAVNDPPLAPSRTVRVSDDAPATLKLVDGTAPLDVDGDPEVRQTLAYTILSGPAHGTIRDFDPATGQFVYEPDAGYRGPDSLRFRVTDDATAGGPAAASEGVLSLSVGEQEEPGSGQTIEPTPADVRALLLDLEADALARERQADDEGDADAAPRPGELQVEILQDGAGASSPAAPDALAAPEVLEVAGRMFAPGGIDNLLGGLFNLDATGGSGVSYPAEKPSGPQDRGQPKDQTAQRSPATDSQPAAPEEERVAESEDRGEPVAAAEPVRAGQSPTGEQAALVDRALAALAEDVRRADAASAEAPFEPPLPPQAQTAQSPSALAAAPEEPDVSAAHPAG